MKKIFLLLSVVALIFSGCKKNEYDPEPPEIEFGGFTYLEKDVNGKDSKVEMIIKFKDVNGDIGTPDGDRTATCGYDYPDLFMYYEKFENGSYVPDYPFYPFPPPPDTVWDANCNIVEIRDTFQTEILYSLTNIEPEGNNKSIEGEISYIMELRTSLFGLVKPHGRFRVFLRDRTGNKSNEIRTDALIITI